MRISGRVRNMKLSGKMMLFYLALALGQFLVSIAILTTIITRTNLDSLKARMAYTVQGVRQSIEETLHDLTLKGELIAGQKKTIEYTDFGLKTLLTRELVLSRDSLDVASLAVFTDPDYPFASTDRLPTDNPSWRGEISEAFRGSARLFLADDGRGTSIFVLSPIRRSESLIGVLSLSLRLDDAFVSRMERMNGATVVVRLNDAAIQAGAAADRSVTAALDAWDRGSAAEGTILMASGHVVGSLGLSQVGLDGGRVFCLLDTRDSTRLIARYNVISLVSTVLILALALVSGFAVYQRTFARRFALILQGIRKTSGGDFNPPFQLDWHDEFGQLVDGFDEMCRKLLVREKELSQLREKLALSSKLAALGEMAAGVAHQIRNPLLVMKVSAEMLRDNYAVTENGERYQKLVSLMVDEADSLNLVVSNFLDFARPRKVSRAPAPIAAIIDFCLDSLPLERFDGITVRRCVPEGIPEVPLDRNLLGQALSNLVLNALQASAPGGTVVVRAGYAVGRLWIEVEDQGEGMTEETMRTIFDPFFTTRESGTGLGLSIVHRIIEDHGGTIDVHSAPGNGSTFRIVL